MRPCAVSVGPAQRGPWLQIGEPRGFEWNCVQVPIRGLAPALEGLRILHVSDLHLRTKWSTVYDQFLARVHDDPPDLLLMTGDFVENRRDYRPALPHVLRFVEGFRARVGCWGILGNHDRYWMAPPLEGTNVALLDGRREVVYRGGAPIELIGLPGVDRRDLSPALVDAMPPREPGMLRVVLSHYPDHLRRTEALQPDLFLTGHTHGGQICLPGGAAIIRHDKLPRPMYAGLHHVDRTWLVVNRGLGFSGPAVRLFCPAEVIELRLTRGGA